MVFRRKSFLQEEVRNFPFLCKTNQERITVIYSRAEKCMANRGKDTRGDLRLL